MTVTFSLTANCQVLFCILQAMLSWFPQLRWRTSSDERDVRASSDDSGTSTPSQAMESFLSWEKVVRSDKVRSRSVDIQARSNDDAFSWGFFFRKSNGKSLGM
jgi:hypothetical protein